MKPNRTRPVSFLRSQSEFVTHCIVFQQELVLFKVNRMTGGAQGGKGKEVDNEREDR